MRWTAFGGVMRMRMIKHKMKAPWVPATVATTRIFTVAVIRELRSHWQCNFECSLCDIIVTVIVIVVTVTAISYNKVWYWQCDIECLLHDIVVTVTAIIITITAILHSKLCYWRAARYRCNRAWLLQRWCTEYGEICSRVLSLFCMILSIIAIIIDIVIIVTVTAISCRVWIMLMVKNGMNRPLLRRNPYYEILLWLLWRSLLQSQQYRTAWTMINSKMQCVFVSDDHKSINMYSMWRRTNIFNVEAYKHVPNVPTYIN